jgi:hypothetical protein
MDAFGAKLFFATPLHQNIALMCETRGLHLFTCQSFLNAPRDSQTSLWVHCGSRMHAFAAKLFSQHRYTKIVHSCPKHKFCIILHAEGFLNALKENQTSLWVQWSRMDAFGV